MGIKRTSVSYKSCKSLYVLVSNLWVTRNCLWNLWRKKLLFFVICSRQNPKHKYGRLKASLLFLVLVYLHILSVQSQRFQVLIGFLDVEKIYKYIILLPTPIFSNNACIACLIIYISLRYQYLIKSVCQIQPPMIYIFCLLNIVQNTK